MTNEQEREALRKMVRAMDHTARANRRRAEAYAAKRTAESAAESAAEPDPGPAAGQVEHRAPAKSTEIPSVYAPGSMRKPLSVGVYTAYRNLAMELTEWH